MPAAGSAAHLRRGGPRGGQVLRYAGGGQAPGGVGGRRRGRAGRDPWPPWPRAGRYRLCGDPNPLHSDPEFAAAAGFPRPILHGLCTYGITCKAMVDACLGSDVSRVRSYGARFAGVVYPGEMLLVRIWAEDSRVVAVVTAPSRDEGPVLSGVELVPA